MQLNQTEILLNQEDIPEVLRLLEYRGQEMNEDIRIRIRSCMEQISDAAALRHVFRVFPMESDGGLPESCRFLKGEDIRCHLAGCTRLILLAATLGISADRLIMKAEIGNLPDALIMDACGSTLIEKYCRELESGLRSSCKRKGRFLTGRFSPGYGDLPLEVQPEMLEVLDARRRIGLTVVESGIMLPRKSMTAVLGISEEPVQEKKLKSCLSCRMAETCRFRKPDIISEYEI